ncbi:MULTISPECIES: hypothetical protein [Haloferax]|uniref:Uncharacterized protein n=1 Tax=Haloferax marinum TaxID=2666143 RepID=A0A6A8G316_9EURY|nr:MULTISPECIES: hypothetical protein [Haloferax]KAB1196199.1 hypothetical protein Hfx1150_01200 [Haloferax sp. CBA1150]MRW95187.1 hypothetical protein [Haloferax marinum]
MNRRNLLLTTGLAFCTPLTGCLGVGLLTESPPPPEPCEPANPGVDLPSENTLNEDDVGAYLRGIEKQRYLDQSRSPEFTTVRLSVNSVTTYDKGFVVDIHGNGSIDMGDNKAIVSIRETVPENVTVKSADTAPFSAIDRLQETIETAWVRLADERCEGRVAAHLSQSEFDTVRAAFEDMESGPDDIYYLRGDVCYIGVKFEDSTVVVTLSHDIPEGVPTESVTAEQFELKPLQEAIDQALSMSEYTHDPASSYLTEEEYDRLKNGFAEMESDKDGFYYLRDNESYAAVKVQRETGPIGHLAPWVARYYVDDMQVRVTADHDAENTADADLEDPTKGEVIVC